MASGESNNKGVEKEDEEFEDHSIASDYLSISGSTSSTIKSDITLMASGECDNTGVEKEDDDSEDDTIASDYLSLSGSTSSTIRSNITSFSRPYLSVRGTEFTNPDIPSVLSTINPEIDSDDVPTMFNELQLEDSCVEGVVFKDKLVKCGKKLCSNCIIDGKQTYATHFCKDCTPGGRYICHKCLKGHNRWSQDHFVKSLSVAEESSIRSGRETSQESNDVVTSGELITTFQEEDLWQKGISDNRDVSEFQEKVINDTKEIEPETNRKGNANVVVKEPDNSGTLHHPKMRLLRPGFYRSEKDTETIQKKDEPCFYKDKLLLEITQDQRYRYPSQATADSYTKYGQYSVQAYSDTKHCIVTGICQLQDGKIVLTDSENCRLKIFGPERFDFIASHKLRSNPSLICYMKESKVAVAFANCEVVIGDISDDVKIRSLFKMKYTCNGLAYGNGNFYVCAAHMIEIYSEKGDRKRSFQPALSDVKLRCLSDISISKNGNTIYAADKDKGIIVMDEEGHVLNTISDNVYEPNRLCLDGSGKLLATEINSGRVLKIDPVHGNVKQVVQDVCNKEYPISLYHERICNRLIVGVWGSDNIHVFACP